MNHNHLTHRLRLQGKHEQADRLAHLEDEYWQDRVTIGQYVAEHAKAFRCWKGVVPGVMMRHKNLVNSHSHYC